MEAMINRTAWEALPTDLQHVVRHACQSTNEDMLAEFTTRNGVALKTLAEKHGVQLKRFSDDVLTKIGRARDVVGEIAAKDPLSNSVYASFNAYRSQSVSYTRISEEAYTMARALTEA